MAKFREQLTVRSNAYSVPVRFIGRQLRVLLHANDLVVYAGRTRSGPLTDKMVDGEADPVSVRLGMLRSCPVLADRT
ncbi:hypothetical protein ACFYXH_35965 [Streptomyces sp. NPDC002730]|uniref:Mu transposase domain-containing protein n=1 Tax=Streptomyces sp. NPDC002730 TaxID=3364662 RepID=UPI003676DA82